MKATTKEEAELIFHAHAKKLVRAKLKNNPISISGDIAGDVNANDIVELMQKQVSDFKSALRAEIETRHKSLSADAPKQISEFGRGVYWAAIAECKLFLDLIETTLPPKE